MRISEVLISITIFALVGICFLNSISVFNKVEFKTKVGMKDCVKILEDDEKIRSEIRKIKIPYWKNTDKLCEAYVTGFKDCVVLNDSEILSVEPLRINGKTEGLKVLWVYKNTRHETEEKFSSRTIF